MLCLSLVLLAQGFEIDLGGSSDKAKPGAPGVELGKSDLAAAQADFDQQRYATALARASQITAGGLTGPVAQQATVLQGLAAVKLQLPRLAVLLVAESLSQTQAAVRAPLLSELGPLFESPVTAPEWARAAWSSRSRASGQMASVLWLLLCSSSARRRGGSAGG